MGSKYFKEDEGAYKLGKYVAKKFIKQSKGGVETITGVAPNVPKTNIEKATRTLKTEGHKIKAKIAKIESDVFHGTQKLKKALDKMKGPHKK